MSKRSNLRTWELGMVFQFGSRLIWNWILHAEARSPWWSDEILKIKIKMPWNYLVVNKSICIFDNWQYKITFFEADGLTPLTPFSTSARTNCCSLLHLSHTHISDFWPKREYSKSTPLKSFQEKKAWDKTTWPKELTWKWLFSRVEETLEVT